MEVGQYLPLPRRLQLALLCQILEIALPEHDETWRLDGGQISSEPKYR